MVTKFLVPVTSAPEFVLVFQFFSKYLVLWNNPENKTPFLANIPKIHWWGKSLFIHMLSKSINSCFLVALRIAVISVNINCCTCIQNRSFYLQGLLHQCILDERTPRYWRRKRRSVWIEEYEGGGVRRRTVDIDDGDAAEHILCVHNNVVSVRLYECTCVCVCVYIWRMSFLLFFRRTYTRLKVCYLDVVRTSRVVGSEYVPAHACRYAFVYVCVCDCLYSACSSFHFHA